MTISVKQAPCGDQTPHGAHEYYPGGLDGFPKHTCLGLPRLHKVRTIWHWTPDNHPDGWIKCHGRADERMLVPGGAVNSGYGQDRIEHRVTRFRMMVNCEHCRNSLPETLAARRDAEHRGSQVVTLLAQLGISASYENRQYPKVELHLIEAEKLQEALDAASQRGVHAGQESAG
jgi:hypothetical protein